MDIMGKCPYFGEPCLKEGCSAFEYQEQWIGDNKEHAEGYKLFEHRFKNKLMYGDSWFALEIPHCRVMKIELPVDRSDKPEITPMPDGGM